MFVYTEASVNEFYLKREHATFTYFQAGSPDSSGRRDRPREGATSAMRWRASFAAVRGCGDVEEIELKRFVHYIIIILNNVI